MDERAKEAARKAFARMSVLARGPIVGSRHVYAALYAGNLRRWHGDEVMASWMTAIGLAGAVAANLGALLIIVRAVYSPDPAPLFPDWVGYGLTGLIFWWSYVTFVHDGQYRQTISAFERLAPHQRRWIAIFGWTYLVLSYVGVVALAFSLDFAAK